MNIFDIFSIRKIRLENENLKHELDQIKKQSEIEIRKDTKGDVKRIFYGKN